MQLTKLVSNERPFPGLITDENTDRFR